MLSKYSMIMIGTIFVAIMTSSSHLALADYKDVGGAGEMGVPASKKKDDQSWMKGSSETDSARRSREAREARMAEMKASMAKEPEEKVLEMKPAQVMELPAKKSSAVQAPKPPTAQMAPASQKRLTIQEQIALNKKRKAEDIQKIIEENKAKKQAIEPNKDVSSSKMPHLGPTIERLAKEEKPPLPMTEEEHITVTHNPVDIKMPSLSVETGPEIVTRKSIPAPQVTPEETPSKPMPSMGSKMDVQTQHLGKTMERLMREQAQAEDSEKMKSAAPAA